MAKSLDSFYNFAQDQIAISQYSWGADEEIELAPYSSNTSTVSEPQQPTVSESQQSIEQDILNRVHEKNAQNPYMQKVGFRKNGVNEQIADSRSDASVVSAMRSSWFSDEEDMNEELSNKLALKNQRGGY